MKSVKLISVILILATLCCTFIACDQGSTDDIELPARPFYDITVSFQIKDSNGRTIIDAVDYNYKGHEDPTILNIISDYLVIVADYKCTIDKNNTLVQVGGLKASVSKGEYWAFMKGTDVDVQTILADKSLQTKNFIDAKMSDYLVEDGASFTIVLVTA
ncbi:MAG: hypothetical protein IJY39_07660 [Clostridia bacterium]|nr:hypothetical protein [Clostridia bacterium]